MSAATRHILSGLHERLTELQGQLPACRSTAMLRCLEGAIAATRRQMVAALDWSSK